MISALKAFGGRIFGNKSSGRKKLEEDEDFETKKNENNKRSRKGFEDKDYLVPEEEYESPAKRRVLEPTSTQAFSASPAIPAFAPSSATSSSRAPYTAFKSPSLHLAPEQITQQKEILKSPFRPHADDHALRFLERMDLHGRPIASPSRAPVSFAPRSSVLLPPPVSTQNLRPSSAARKTRTNQATSSTVVPASTFSFSQASASNVFSRFFKPNVPQTATKVFHFRQTITARRPPSSSSAKKIAEPPRIEPSPVAPQLPTLPTSARFNPKAAALANNNNVMLDDEDAEISDTWPFTSFTPLPKGQPLRYGQPTPVSRSLSGQDSDDDAFLQQGGSGILPKTPKTPASQFMTSIGQRRATPSTPGMFFLGAGTAGLGAEPLLRGITDEEEEERRQREQQQQQNAENEQADERKEGTPGFLRQMASKLGLMSLRDKSEFRQREIEVEWKREREQWFREIQGMLCDEVIGELAQEECDVHFDRVYALDSIVDEIVEEYCSELAISETKPRIFVPKFAPEDKDRFEHATSGKLVGSQILVTAYNVELTRANMRSVRGSNWLNDEVINWYMNMLQDRSNAPSSGVPKCHFFNSFFYLKLYPPEKGYSYASVRRWTKNIDIFSMDRVIVPVHLGVHWTCAAINIKQKRFEYYDSLGADNRTCLDALRRYVQDEHMDKKKTKLDTSDWSDFTPKDIPMQNNAVDCGVFTCMFAECMGRGAPFDFDQKHMPDYRISLVLQILDMKTAR